MMDQILEVLHALTPFLHVLTAILIVLKSVMVFRNKGFNIPALVASFFRIYTRSDVVMSHNAARRQYMHINNWINYYIYCWIFITIIIIVVFQSFY